MTDLLSTYLPVVIFIMRQMARRDENFALLSARMPVPCWGRLPHAPQIDAGTLSRHIALPF